MFDARQLENSPLVTDNDDPEARIADLERQVAEQKRIAELERQLAEAKAAVAQSQDADDGLARAAARQACPRSSWTTRCSTAA